MTVRDPVLSALPPQPYESIRGQVRDGDLLLCAATDMGSRLIRWATQSVWSHVAIAFRMAEIDRILILECVNRIGVRAVPLSDFITRTSSGTHPYPGRIILARHQLLARQESQMAMKRMSEFAFDRLGAKFSKLETAKIALRIAFGRLNKPLPRPLESDDEYICSEYVAKCYESIGLPIAWDGRGFIAPADIARDPGIDAVARIRTSDDDARDRG